MNFNHIIQRINRLTLRRYIFIFTIAAAISTTLVMLPAHAKPKLPETVSKALKKAKIPLSATGIWVQRVDQTQPLLQLNGGERFNPASVMKVVVTYAALKQLGRNHAWTTVLSHDGKIEHNTLDGNLYLQSFADPSLDSTRLSEAFQILRAQGIDIIRGNIVIDTQILKLPRHNPATFDAKPLRPYNSGPYGFLLNANTLTLRLTPGDRPGDPVSIIALTPLKNLSIEQTITSTKGHCGIWYRHLKAEAHPQRNGLKLRLSGQLPSSCATRHWGIAPLTPAHFSAQLIAGLWHKNGGTLRGDIVAGTPPSASLPVLYRSTSEPLSTVVRTINKWSSNVMARQLLAYLGYRTMLNTPRSQQRNMVRAGITHLHKTLHSNQISTSGLHIDNGAGLSRTARITPRTLGQLLRQAWHDPIMPEFVASLPISGIDGTARKQLRHSPASGYAHVKTGTINQVRAIAGYVLDSQGRRYVVVLLINHPNSGAGRPVIDALLASIWQGQL